MDHVGHGRSAGPLVCPSATVLFLMKIIDIGGLATALGPEIVLT